MGRSSPTIIRPSVVLPQPDSPTMPKVSPARTVSETPETACTTRPGLKGTAAGRWKRLTTPASSMQRLARHRGSAVGLIGRGARAASAPVMAAAGAEAVRRG